MAQIVKNLPAMLETQVQSLGWNDPLEKEMATHCSTCLDNSMHRGAWLATFHGIKELDTTELLTFCKKKSDVPAHAVRQEELSLTCGRASLFVLLRPFTD